MDNPLRASHARSGGRSHAEPGQKRGRHGNSKRLVCGGPVIRAALMQRAATTSEGWEVAASPSRWAVQYAPTTRVRAAVPLVKLAVKHLASLHLSRVYRPMRTLDRSRPPDDATATTRFYDLLAHTEREGRAIQDDTNREWEIECILAQRTNIERGEPEYKVGAMARRIRGGG